MWDSRQAGGFWGSTACKQYTHSSTQGWLQVQCARPGPSGPHNSLRSWPQPHHCLTLTPSLSLDWVRLPLHGPPEAAAKGPQPLTPSSYRHDNTKGRRAGGRRGRGRPKDCPTMAGCYDRSSSSTVSESRNTRDPRSQSHKPSHGNTGPASTSAWLPEGLSHEDSLSPTSQSGATETWGWVQFLCKRPLALSSPLSEGKLNLGTAASFCI